jgi:hypothetical protein
MGGAEGDEGSCITQSSGIGACRSRYSDGWIVAALLANEVPARVVEVEVRGNECDVWNILCCGCG